MSDNQSTAGAAVQGAATQANGDTQQAVNAQIGAVSADAVAAHMGEPAPTTIGDQIDVIGRFLNQLHARVTQIEQVIGAVAPLGEAAADLLPQGQVASTAINVIERVPMVERAINGILSVLDAEFGSKLSHKLPDPIRPPVASGSTD